MENGSFHTSEILDSNEQLDELIRSIPLPNQLPQSMNFRDIPGPALKSSTVESLISQNEDLMARLSVSLRKANQFEEKTGLLERELSVLTSKFETLKEQFLVQQEKDRFTSTRSHQLLEENGALKEQTYKLEKVYSELYVQAQAFQRRVQQLERYRVRMQKIAPALQQKAKSYDKVEEHRKAFVLSYEAKLAEARAQVDNLQFKARERDLLYEDKVNLQNELVEEQRMHQNYRAETHPLLDNLKRENSELRIQLKESLLAEESLRQQLADMSLQFSTLKEENSAFSEQVESLQALWGHKQRELDHLEEKNAGLQKLNQSLSMTLNQQRKEMQSLQTEMDNERFAAQDKIKTLNQEVEMLRAELRNSSSTTPAAQSPSAEATPL